MARTLAYGAQSTRVFDLPIMGDGSMPLPTAGEVIYLGSTTIHIFSEPETTQLFGDSAVMVNFETEAVSGTLDNFFGVVGYGEDARVLDYSGSLEISGGDIGLTDVYAFGADYGGQLTADGQIIDVEGAVTGNFHGIQAEAISASDLNASVNINGDPLTSILVIVGEK